MANSLTGKQKAFLAFIKQFIAEHETWPGYKHFVEEFGYRSPNSVTQNLRALERKKYIARHGTGYRLCPVLQPEPGIPIVGTITAGQLQEAVEANLGTITLTMLFPNLDRLYALRVTGQSMKGADIEDGDYVLLVDDDIPDGGIGAILFNGETSLKRIFMDARGLRLEPANPEFDDIRIEPDIFEEVTILGRYIGHVNRKGVFKASERSRRLPARRFSPFRHN